MVGYADKPNPSSFFSLQQSAIATVRVLRVWQHSGIMQLQDINIVCIHPFQAEFNMAEQGLFIRCAAFGR